MGINMRAAWISILLLFIPALLWADHIPWMRDYKDAFGVSCCGIEDCRLSRVFVIDGHGLVEIDGVMLRLPVGSIHVLPLEAHGGSGWVCLRPSQCPEQINVKCVRCLFYRTGES